MARASRRSLSTGNPPANDRYQLDVRFAG